MQDLEACVSNLNKALKYKERFHMGRGRQKAKATKQAREMKYYTPNTNLNELERELSSENVSSKNNGVQSEAEDSPNDEYYSDLAAKYADMYDLSEE